MITMTKAPSIENNLGKNLAPFRTGVYGASAVSTPATVAELLK